MKRICLANNIPTAKFKICHTKVQIDAFLKSSKLPIVVADGLAAGKGVSICKTNKQVFKKSSDIFKGKVGSSKKVVLEEFLDGHEASYFLIIDKSGFKFLELHKIIREFMKMIKVLILEEWEPILQHQLTNLRKKIIEKIVEPTPSKK